MEVSLQRALTVFVTAISLFVAISSIVGCIHFFSPIPFFDQWDGFVGFYQTVREGHALSAFWAQHNEHRIVVSRVLFWMDIAWFGGMNVSTIGGNWLLCAGIALAIIVESRRVWTSQVTRLFTAAFAIALALSWAQRENLTWGFESQCLLVYLFAILAFARLSRDDPKNINLAAALVFSVLATISMGNGIAVFAVGAIQCFLLRQSWRRIFALCASGALTAALYFHDYTRPMLQLLGPIPEHATRTKIQYFFSFLGNAIFYSIPNIHLAFVFGLATFLIASLTVLNLYRTGEITPFRAFLIGCYGFVLVTALGATHSRWMLDLSSSISSRYTTPTLLGMSVLGFLLIDITETTSRRRFYVMFALSVVVAALAPSSLRAYGDNSILFGQKMAVLGQKIGLVHPEYVQYVYPLNQLAAFEKRATTANLYQIGPYRSGWLHDAGLVKFDATRIDPSLCIGSMDAIRPDTAGQTAVGWVVATQYAQPSTLIVLADGQGNTVGYGVTGIKRPDIRKLIPDAPHDSGWVGFVEKDAHAVRPFAYVGGEFCPIGNPSS
ncbi:glycosyltransferase family 87 protein [Paraburkholderia sp. J67]|uniref:glycosyltransferase family 87 protein n=1 Tax=Paraburkholderia sp. J67 TaxID=2805435 RepID=UPI002ABDEDFD|nr:glycosyltransferase family 87 protein [Paraburkholderia sp. J67]